MVITMSEKFKKIFEDVKSRAVGFDASGYGGFLAIQVTLKDLGEDFYVEIKDGKLSMEPYGYNDRQAKMIISSANFEKLINGKLNPVLAFTTGKLKIEGDISKVQEFSKVISKKQ
jgi:putative sterol carrier protein